MCIISSFPYSPSAEVVSFGFLLLLCFLRELNHTSVRFYLMLLLTRKKEIVNNCELNDEKSVNCKKWIKMFSFKDLFTVTEQQLLHTVSCGNFRNIFHTEQTQKPR